jgi:AcrR family transcriptional regulator
VANHRDKLLDGALQCLGTKGYARTTARDLVAASGTNLSSIGYHFGSKEALLNEAVGRAFERWSEEVAKAAFADEDAEPWERVVRGLAATVEAFERYRPLLAAFFEAMAHVESDEELRQQFARCYEESRAQVAAMVEAAFGPGGAEVHGIDARVAASLLLAMCDGLIVQWLTDRDRAPTAEELTDLLTAAGGFVQRV